MKYLLTLFLLSATFVFSQPTLLNSDGTGMNNPTFRNAVLPAQGPHSGKFLTTNGTDASWATVTSGTPSGTGFVKVSGGVLTPPSATIPIADITGLGTAATANMDSATINAVLDDNSAASRAALALPGRSDYLRHTLADLTNARIGQGQLQLRLFTLGDSWGGVNLSDPFRGAFGHYGQIMQAGAGTMTDPPTMRAGQHTKYSIGSYSGDTVLIDASGETLTWSAVAGNFEPSSKLIIAYRRTPGGGTFQPQVRNSGGTFVSAGPIINTNGTEGIIWYSYSFSDLFGYAAAPTQLRIAWGSGASEIVAGGLMDNSGQPKIRPGNMNRHGVIAYNAQFNGSSAEMWNTIPQQSWDSLMDFMAPQIVFLRDWRETGVDKDYWFGQLQSVMVKIQTGRKSASTASLVYGLLTATVTVTSDTVGIAGESIRCKFIAAGNNTPLTVAVSGTDITINLATGPSGIATSTAAQVVAKLNEVSTPSAALITASGSGAGFPGSVDTFMPLSTGVGVDFVMLGSNPVSDDLAAEVAISDATMRAWCVANRVMFVDTRAAFPATYADSVREGFSQTDGLHTVNLGSKLIEKTVFEALGIRQIVQPYQYGTSSPQSPQFYGGEGVQTGWYSHVNLQSGVAPPSIGFRRTDGGISNLGDHWRITPKAKDSTFISEGAKETLYAAPLLTTKTLRQIDGSGLQAIGFDTDMSRAIGGRLEIGTTSTSVTPVVMGAIAGQTVPILSIKTGTAHNAAGTQVSGFDKQGVPFVASHTTTTRDALTSVIAGSIILNTTTGKLNFYTGSAWEAVTSAP